MFRYLVDADDETGWNSKARIRDWSFCLALTLLFGFGAAVLHYEVRGAKLCLVILIDALHPCISLYLHLKLLDRKIYA